ncbi:Fe-S cluster assembly protein SufD [Haloferax mediterranei ATCC 33500]|uniref:ABC transporter permease n=1 Tax=Haloferax mediterranei (strain ATCC 33500 / DSM 1411 / JCM 8866 / NBRC 14739 / NCIMB 2177 / R-4) TaxID=523841 RepID=I3R2U1_HALMT|nr:Fe-S cluster assembly protein SufD [Haloferax mediterranei]AFK18551.1 ABC-type transport system involved in Fe-S cluster assembly, permease protein II [Haloferax mediterranei ATCC 33500]AHZ22071.1 ABC transporter permease [Haloferax mediterranei ATCC 33500]EMA02174.1 ABC-type transport system involved in Fe-S cluster assembly, permease protein II [Haloferax mediterranei ATCC 33500]MDX5988642.1 Fe-S cluster assembly protein SufD [Haloferax mediterranei ATCC 33500]QCQ75056.1 Fe-S cluster asse
MSAQLPANLSVETVREISDARDEPEWLLEARLEALEALDELELPDVIQTPGRRWTNLEALDFESLVDPLNQSDETSREAPEDAVVLSFTEALDEYGDLIEEHFGSVVDLETNYLTALSAALFTTGTFVYVPESVDAEDVKIRAEMNSRSLFSHTLVVTEKSSSVTILEAIESGNDIDDARYFSNLVEVVAGENSYVQYGSLQNLDEETYTYSLKRGDTDTYSTINWIEGNLGSKLTRSDVETELNGEASETKIVGAFFGHDDQHLDVNARVWHNAENTTADLVTRGVLDDEARSVYEGVQDVGRDAWSTNSYQRENTLMLSDESEADASPKLIINNHDTEASHAATVGQVDKEDLFYMVSRSVPEQQARNMLVEGFFVPVLEEIEVDEFRDDLEELIAARLH